MTPALPPRMSSGTPPAVHGRRAVLVAAGGASWEAAALRRLEESGYAVLKRCVDLHDLLGTAATGQAEVAVVSGDLVGLDADAVVQLLRHDVRCVAIGGSGSGSGETLTRLGVLAVVPPEGVQDLPDVVDAAGGEDLVTDPEPWEDDGAGPATGGRRGRVVAVHGPAGAPGRTTVAVALAAENARRGRRSVLVDADPHGGAVAQHLGILDEVSGLLAAARLANSGGLDEGSFTRCRRVAAPGFEVVTGLPRPDRWIEVRSGALEAVLDRACEVGDVVLDTGFSLEDDADLGRQARNQLTLDAVAAADEVVVVGSAEPTGLARLARTLVDLREATPAPTRVVVNRMRDSLGWSRRDIVGMVEGYVRPLGVHFLPEDRAATDRALVAGRSLVEVGDSALRRALSELVDVTWAAEVARSAQKPPISR